MPSCISNELNNHQGNVYNKGEARICHPENLSLRAKG